MCFADVPSRRSPPPVVFLGSTNCSAITFIKRGKRLGSLCRRHRHRARIQGGSRVGHFIIDFSPTCKGAKMSSFGWLYFLIIYTSKELFTGLVSHLSLSLPPSIFIALASVRAFSQGATHAAQTAFMPLKAIQIFKSHIETVKAVSRHEFTEQNIYFLCRLCLYN